MNRTFLALTTTVSIDVETELACAPLLAALVASYPTTSAAPELSYRFDPRGVWRNGVLLAVETIDDLVPQFELDLYEQVVARANAGWLLHAAAIEIDGRALVFAGASGAGKTTLTLALVARGYRLLTEEIVLISRAGMVSGLSRPLHVVMTSVQPIPDSWNRVSYAIRGRDGVETQTLAIPSDQDVTHEALPLGALVGLTHGPDRVAGLERFEPRTALQRFWDTTLRPDDDGLHTATTILRQHPAYRLASTRFDEALTALQPLVPTHK